MFPGEMIILMAAVASENSSKKQLTRSMDITSEYIGYLYVSLVKRGYLKEVGSGEYQLSTKGWEAFSEFLRDNKTKGNTMVKRLLQLGIDITQRIDEPEEEVVVKLK